MSHIENSDVEHDKWKKRIEHNTRLNRKAEARYNTARNIGQMVLITLAVYFVTGLVLWCTDHELRWSTYWIFAIFLFIIEAICMYTGLKSLKQYKDTSLKMFEVSPKSS